MFNFLAACMFKLVHIYFYRAPPTEDHNPEQALLFVGQRRSLRQEHQDRLDAVLRIHMEGTQVGRAKMKLLLYHFNETKVSIRSGFKVVLMSNLSPFEQISENNPQS